MRIMQSLRYLLPATGLLLVATLAIAQVRGTASSEPQTDDGPVQVLPARGVAAPPAIDPAAPPPPEIPVSSPPGVPMPDLPPGAVLPPDVGPMSPMPVPGGIGGGAIGRPPRTVGPEPGGVIVRPGETRFAMSLKDGSRLVGKPVGMAQVAVTTSFGKVEIPIGQIQGIQSRPGSVRVKIRFRNGDVLSGTMKSQSIRFKTDYGEITIPVTAVVHMQLGSAFATADGADDPDRARVRRVRRTHGGYRPGIPGDPTVPRYAPPMGGTTPSTGVGRAAPDTTTIRPVPIRDAAEPEVPSAEPVGRP